jgi:hypothetical protein
MLKNARLFLLGLLALPMIGLTAIVVSRAALVVGHATATLQADADKPEEEKQRAANEIHMKPGDIREFTWQTVLRADEISPRRHVRVVAYMDYSEIAEKKHAEATPTDQKIFANLYAPDAAQKECARIQMVFADKCEVEHATAEPVRVDRYLVEMNLLFTNKDSFGPPYTAADAETYQESPVALTTPGGGPLIAFSQQASERMGLYRQAAQSCEDIRRNKGDCAIGEMELISKQAGHTSDILRIDGKALLLALRRRNESSGLR